MFRVITLILPVLSMLLHCSCNNDHKSSNTNDNIVSNTQSLVDSGELHNDIVHCTFEKLLGYSPEKRTLRLADSLFEHCLLLFSGQDSLLRSSRIVINSDLQDGLDSTTIDNPLKGRKYIWAVNSEDSIIADRISDTWDHTGMMSIDSTIYRFEALLDSLKYYPGLSEKARFGYLNLLSFIIEDAKYWAMMNSDTSILSGIDRPLIKKEE